MATLERSAVSPGGLTPNLHDLPGDSRQLSFLRSSPAHTVRGPRVLVEWLQSNARPSAFLTAQPLLEKTPVAPSLSTRGLPSRDSAECHGAPRPFHKMVPVPRHPRFPRA